MTFGTGSKFGMEVAKRYGEGSEMPKDPFALKNAIALKIVVKYYRGSILGGHFGPEKKYLAPHPPHRHAPGALPPPAPPPRNPPPPSLYFFIKKPAPRPPPRTPPPSPPPRNRKKTKNIWNVHQVFYNPYRFAVIFPRKNSIQIAIAIVNSLSR